MTCKRNGSVPKMKRLKIQINNLNNDKLRLHQMT